MIMKRENGFTLVELLITIVVVSILLATGVPSFMQMIKNNRLTAQTNSLVAAIQVTRNEAVKRGTSMVICAKKSDAVACSDDKNWANGWIIFSDLDQGADLDGDGICTTTDDHHDKECVLRTTNSLQRNTLTGNNGKIQFNPDGTAVDVDVNPIRLTADDCKQQQVREITITMQGHAIVAKQDCP